MIWKQEAHNTLLYIYYVIIAEKILQAFDSLCYYRGSSSPLGRRMTASWAREIPRLTNLCRRTAVFLWFVKYLTSKTCLSCPSVYFYLLLLFYLLPLFFLSALFSLFPSARSAVQFRQSFAQAEAFEKKYPGL